MVTLLKIIHESILQAFQQLVGNKLRSFLSLLGITIGIFCIIAVQSAVDSLEDNVRGSLQKLGDDIVFVQKMPMLEDPFTNFWKYQRRPNPSYKDYQFIKKKVKSAATVDYHVFIGMKTAKYRSNSAERVAIAAVTHEFDELFNVEYQRGRWYTPLEYSLGQNKVVIGHSVKEQLFGPRVDPIGRKISLMGQKLEIIGVFEKSGKDLIKPMDMDEAIIISYELGKKVANMKSNHPFGTNVNVKAKDGVGVDQLKDDLTGVLRAGRKLKPKEEDNFALNSLSMLSSILDQFFGALSTAGIMIGGFAILVGIFSVANIMFVSVKERTNIIGIKKALGAKKGIILLEFLIESVILCILGGIIGLIMVFGILAILKGVLPFPVFLSVGNVIFGIILSIFIGVVSGFIPAYQAAQMNPVDAIRA